MTKVQAPPGRLPAQSPGRPARGEPRPKATTASGPADPAGRRGRLGPLVVGQLVVLELCALAVWAATAGPVWVLAAVATPAVLLTVAVFARRGGRWFYEDLLLRGRLRRRRDRAKRAATAGTLLDPRLAPLAPELTVTELTDRGTRLGIGQDNQGWFAALALHGASGAPSGPVEAALVDRALRVLGEFHGPVTRVQVVAHTLVWFPAPGAAPAAHRTVWIALRLSVRDARIETVTRGGGLPGVHRTLSTGVGRLGKALTAAGVAHHPLSRDELRAAVLSATGLDLVAMPPAETWTGLRGGGWTHRCLALRARSDTAFGALVDGVTATAAPSHTLAAGVLPGGRIVAPLLRVGATDNHVEALVKVVGEVARRFGAPARPVDGQHGPGVYATAPVAATVDR
ncbi:type VII secretion protein EccE [Micromonospora endolithica]|uniref:Type VII secretion protein EccE n=1 Tax=Micromonospora endolithica TaxID=230091 RepID=A0A3A9Z170_9ACTN|nr:type VII secretion protein EccE [Micromonospora endolithica]RKN41127.1 type VII secretion protein EccE [Micromonospora endolithica]TWJ24361.1 type VII secretion protein EccE [Micromonospora endolithica]